MPPGRDPALTTVISPLTGAAPADPEALPPEWAAWAEEPGRAVQVRDGGTVLGSLHAAVVGRGEAWVEGLWVRSEARGRGIAARLLAAAEEVVRGYGATTLRAAVPAHAAGVLARAQRAGFTPGGRAAVLTAGLPCRPGTAEAEPPVAPATIRETAALVRLLAASPQVGGWRGLVPLGWRFRRLIPELVRGLIKDGRVLRAGEPASGAACVARRGEVTVISWLTGSPDARGALLDTLVRQARAAGSGHVALFAADRAEADDLPTPFAAHPWCPDGLIVLEKQIPVR